MVSRLDINHRPPSFDSVTTTLLWLTWVRVTPLAVVLWLTNSRTRASSFVAETIDLVVSVESFGEDGAWVTGLAEPRWRDGRASAEACAETDPSTQGPPRLSQVRISSRLATLLRQAGATLDDGLVRPA